MTPEELAKTLVQEKILEKSKITNKTTTCTEITGITNNTPIFIYTYKGKHTGKTIAKITNKPQGCIEALIDPEGLYTIPPEKPNKQYTQQINQKIKTIIRKQQTTHNK